MTVYTIHTQLYLLTIEFRTHRSVTFRFGNGQQREAGLIGYQCGNFQPLVYFFYMFNFIANIYILRDTLKQ